MNGATLMELIKSRDYQAAADYLVVEGRVSSRPRRHKS